MKTTKVIFGFVWMLAIAYFFYFQNHPYYLSSSEFLPQIIVGLLGLIIVGGIILGIQITWNNYKTHPLDLASAKSIPTAVSRCETPLDILKISLWKTILIIVVLTAGILTFQLIEGDIAVYHGGTIFQDSESWSILPQGTELEEGMTAIVWDGEVIGNSEELTNLLPAEVQASFTKVNWAKGVLITEGRLLLGLIFFMVLVIAAYSIGHAVLRRTSVGRDWENDVRKLDEFALSTATGFAIYMAVMFAVGVVQMAYLPVVIGVIVVLTALSWRDTWGFLKTIITKNFAVKIDVKNFTFWMVCGALVVFLYNILEIVRPIPIGWDDINYYAYIPEKYVYLKGLLGGVGGMYNWELVSAIGSYAKTGMFELFTNFGGGLLALVAIYLVLNKFISKERAVLLISFFYVLPAVIFQSSTDLKNDLPLLFFVLMAFYAFREEWWYLAAALIGVAVGIKITAGMALIVMLILACRKVSGKIGAIGTASFILGVLLFKQGYGNVYGISVATTQIVGVVLLLASTVLWYTSYRREKYDKKIAKKMAIFVGVILLTLLPWVIKNSLIDGVPLTVDNYVASSAGETDLRFDGYTDGCTINSGLGDEFSQYVVGIDGDKADFLSLLKMPWQMTMNEGFTGIYVDISFVFFGILPLLVWYLIEKKDKKFQWLTALTAIYCFLLIFFFNGIVWYGFPAVIGLMVLMGILLENYEKDSWRGEKILSLIIKTALAITVISVVFVRVASSGQMEHLAYLGGIISNDEYTETVNPGLMDAKKLMGEDTIYKVGSAMYFFADTDATFYKDESLDTFECLLNVNGEEKTAEILREKGINYISFDFTNLLDDKISEDIKSRYLDLYNFGKKYFKTAVQKNDYVLFEIQ